jgi:phosphate-selective porin OprO/OprP
MKLRTTRLHFSNSISIFSLCWIGSALSGTAANTPDAFKDLCDEAWGSMALYKSDTNPVIQKFAFTGRYQGDYIHINGRGVVPGTPGKQDLHDDDYNTRRLRGGFKATLFEDFTMHVEADLKLEEDPVYNRLTDAYIGWSYSDALKFKLGKQRMEFTLDGSISSKKLLTIDRNNLSNNLWFSYEYLPGLSVGGKHDNWHYKTGVFSRGQADREFGLLNAGTTWLASVGYDFSDRLASDEALLKLDYVYNDDSSSRSPVYTNRSLANIVSLNFRYADDNYGVRTDLAYGDGSKGQSNLWGFTVMPFYDFTPCLQGVLRYTYVESGGDNGVRLTGYESATVNKAKGDQYQEAYAGLNYYIYGNKLKVLTGLSYISMRDQANDGGAFDGMSWITGLRLSW